MPLTDTNFSERVIRFIITRNDDELGELTVLKVAEELKVSQSHLYHIFTQEKRMQPGRFLTMMKMLRAAALLENEPDTPIKSISKKMGFSSSDYFSRIFKEHFGITPGKYREYKRSANWKNNLD